MRYHLLAAAGLAGALAVTAQPCAAQTLDKGHRILIDRGIQSTGMVTTGDVFHLDTYHNAGFTAVNWIWNSNNSALGAAPGCLWSRWVSNLADMPPLPGEAEYMPNLVALSLNDEQNFNDASVRASTAAWYNAVRSSFPNTILFSNSYGGQLDNPSLEAFINECQPDMLSFDTYPFGEGGPTGGSPTNLYGDMQRYRKFALPHGLPYAMYTQTYHATSEARRDPSDSELRLNYFSGLTFGFTYFSCFTYNTGASALFTSPGGDSYPTPRYATMTDINARLAKLSPVMTRLKSSLKYQPNLANAADVREVGLFFIRGKHMENGTAVFNATPIDMLDDTGSNFGNFIANTNDPWLRGWGVQNLGTQNDGLAGDVIIGWFKVLDESFDGTYTDQTYVMILNGLTSPTGSGADCRQRIQLNYLSSAPEQLERLNQQTGEVDVIDMPVDQATGRRRPVFDIDGGCCELYKFKTGAPFVGVAPAGVKGWELY